MIKGRICKINSTIYTVDTEKDYINCSIRGVFRNKKITPLVGDYVIVNEDTKQVVEILDRKNLLERPNIANIDVALIVTSTKKPDLDLVLLDKLLVNVIARDIKPLVCFTKIDLLSDDEINKLKIIYEYYEKIGIDCITPREIDKFKEIVSKKVIVCCGQTGAGKSTFINKIDSTLNLETKPISEALNRGVHTTRYVTLYKVDDYYIADTPGFSSLELTDLEDNHIKDAFIEFANYNCKYRDCSHINTDGCSIENNNNILQSRYDNYKKFIEEKHENRGKLFKK